MIEQSKSQIRERRKKKSLQKIFNHMTLTNPISPRSHIIIDLSGFSITSNDFLLVRNPAIKIIGKRNEREGEKPIQDPIMPPSSAPLAPSSPAPIDPITPQQQQETPAGSREPADTNQDSKAAQTSAKAVNGLPAIGGAEPGWSLSVHQQNSRTASQLCPSKAEASSRLEALLNNTPKFVQKNHESLDNNSENDDRLCHIVKFEAAKSRLPRPIVFEEKSQHCGGLAKNNQTSGKRFRSSIRIMVRPEAVQQLQKPVRANSSDGLSSRSTSTGSDAARSAKKLSAAGVRGQQPQVAQEVQEQVQQQPQRAIVKEQFR